MQGKSRASAPEAAAAAAPAAAAVVVAAAAPAPAPAKAVTVAAPLAAPAGRQASLCGLLLGAASPLGRPHADLAAPRAVHGELLRARAAASCRSRVPRMRWNGTCTLYVQPARAHTAPACKATPRFGNSWCVKGSLWRKLMLGLHGGQASRPWSLGPRASKPASRSSSFAFRESTSAAFSAFRAGSSS